MDNRGKTLLLSKFIIGDKVIIKPRNKDKIEHIGEIVEIYFVRYRIYYQVRLLFEDDSYESVPENRLNLINGRINNRHAFKVKYAIGDKVCIDEPTFKSNDYSSVGYINNVQITPIGNWYLINVGKGVCVGEAEENIWFI